MKLARSRDQEWEIGEREGKDRDHGRKGTKEIREQRSKCDGRRARNARGRGARSRQRDGGVRKIVATEWPWFFRVGEVVNLVGSWTLSKKRAVIVGVPTIVAQHHDTRSMTIEANNRIVTSRDSQHVTLHVRLTPETKDHFNEESLMRFSVRDQTSVTSPMRHPRLPNRATLINSGRPEKGARDRDA